MPKPLAPALKLAAQSLVLQGFCDMIISQRINVNVGTIKAWRLRNKWEQAKAEGVAAKQELHVATAVLLKEPDNQVSKASTDARKALSSSILACLSKVGIPADEKSALKQQSQLEPLVRNARTVFGWSDSGQEPMINIALMEQCGLVTDQPTTKVINLSSAPALEAQAAQVLLLEPNKHSFSVAESAGEGGQPPLTQPVEVG